MALGTILVALGCLAALAAARVAARIVRWWVDRTMAPVLPRGGSRSTTRRPRK